VIRRLLAALALTLVATPAWAQIQVSSPLTKGTQGANGFTIQELKDAGRTAVTITADAVTPAASDTLVTVAKLVGDTATAGVTTYQVTSGKTLRIQNVHISFTSSTTTANKVRVRLRTLSSGACIATSPLVGTYEIALPPGTLAANQGTTSLDVAVPDGLEFSGATRNICFSAIAAAANGTLTITLVGYEY
jgi:hypothetical protein